MSWLAYAWQMRLLGLGVCICLLVGCSVETRARGQRCQRTAQCGVGLACVEGTCTTDLRSVAETSTVPDLGGANGGAGRAAAGSGGAGAGGVAADGGSAAGAAGGA